MKAKKAKSPFINDQFNVLIAVLDPKGKFSPIQREIIKLTLESCYLKGIIDYLDGKVKGQISYEQTK